MTLHIEYPAVMRGRRRVLEADSILAPAPASVAIVGVNGSGKTSLFMHLTGVLRSSRRSPAAIRLHGRRPGIGWVPQTPALPEWLDAAGAARLYGLSFDALLDRMPALHLEELGSRPAGALSVGQRQALAIAFAIGAAPDLLVMDEPFSALDFRRRLGVLELLRAHVRRGGGLMLSSQSAGDLIEVCTHLVVIRDGRQVFQGSPAQLSGDDTSLAAIEQRLLQLLV